MSCLENPEIFYGGILSHLKPEDRIHNFLKILKEVVDALHLLEENVELQPHLHLDGDGGLRLHPEGGVVLAGVGPYAVLELSKITLVSLVEVWPGHKGRGLHLTLGHILMLRNNISFET